MKDNNVQLVTGHRLAQTIPNCEATFYTGEGHLIMLNNWPEILVASIS